MRSEPTEFPLFSAGTVFLLPPVPRVLSLDLFSSGPGDFTSLAKEKPEGFHLEISAPLRAALAGQMPLLATIGAGPAEPRRPPLFRGRTRTLTLGVLAAVPVVGELAWWKGNRHSSFHFNSEGWFDRGTYAGGADKVSHFFFGYFAGRELAKWYERFGNSPQRSRALAVGLTTLGGALVEIGDGFTTVYGYSWNDVVSNVAGALASVGIAVTGIDDLVGFRYGFVSARIPPPANRAYGYGGDYSEDVYSADFKLAGALRRLLGRPGIGRFFLLSLTYGSKGYRFSPPDVRERNVGVDLGLNMPEILIAIGVPRTRWWGEVLLTLFEYIRIPYTAYGFQYDLNHRRWHGPSTGDRFDPGKVIYQ